MNKFLIFIGIVLFLSSCKKTTTTEELPTPVQDVVGFVSLYDQYGDYQQNGAGVTVSLDSTSFSATTDTNGKFVLKNVPTGYYSVSYSKSGYITYKASFSNYLGGQAYLLPSAYLYAPSANVVTNLAVVYDSSNGYYRVYGTVGPLNVTNEQKAVTLFIGLTPSVSPTNNVEGYYLSNTNNGFSYEFPFNNYSGKTIYIVGYGATADYGYTNAATEQYVYTALTATPSNVVPLSIP